MVFELFDGLEPLTVGFLWDLLETIEAKSLLRVLRPANQ